MDLNDLHVILAYKNFAIFKGISHIGLGVSAHLTAKYLNRYGIRTQVQKLALPTDVDKMLQQQIANGTPATHVVVAAPWIPSDEYGNLCAKYPFVHFAMNCHSNLGFLQADATGAKLFREALEMEQGTMNFHAAANCTRFADWVQSAYRRPCAYLPNLYYLDPLDDPSRPSWIQTGGVLRIGIFGAARAQKNIMTAVGAAIEISSILKAQTEIWVSTEREDDWTARGIMSAVRALTDNLPLVRLVPAPWASWPKFRQIVASMHLCLQVSYTESFNLVTADCASEGIPVVVSSAIDWAPPAWFAEVDDTQDVTSVGISLLNNPIAARQGLTALRRHNSLGAIAWENWLTNTAP